MLMRDDQPPKVSPNPDQPPLGTLDPRQLSSVPPPPMVVVHKGWWRDRVTERPAAELAEEGRERHAHG